ncbi:MAG: FG-GAP-like repeat-containing protein [Saprospiraceae bacterium]
MPLKLRLLLFVFSSFFLLKNQAIAQDCSLINLPTQFKARLAWQSSQDAASVVATPMVANMNPQADSMPEIIVAEGSFGTWDRIQFYRGDGSNADNPLILTVPGGFDYYPAPGPTIGDVDGDGIPELLMACNDRRVRVFNNYTETPGAPMNLWITSTGLLDFIDQRPLLADFDGDGKPEVYAGSDIYQFDFSNPAAASLTKIINGPANQGRAQYGGYAEGSCNPTAVDLLTVADCNGDPDCTGLELVAGPVIYSIDLDLGDGDGYQIKVQRNLNTMVVPNPNYSDGYTAVADLDLDGTLDIVVSSLRQNNQYGVYVWNKNGLIRFFRFPTNPINSGSLACVANVYDDTQLGYAVDFPEILVCSSFNFTCFSLHAAQSFPAAPYWWNLPTTDFSGWTGSTVYDFNGDGISEIVYRDEENLRILYGGGTPFPVGVDTERNWFKTPGFSRTSDEYPVVADVDNDGETEIAVTGRLTDGNFNVRGRMQVYESDAGPWVPCRNVWNQYNYFIVNVNDDLSIPAQQDFHHLELPAAGSGIRPLNRYLSQRPLLNENFEPFIPLADASAMVDQVNCYGDSVTVQLNVCNSGDKSLPAGTPVAFYQSDPTTTTAALLGTVQWTSEMVKVDSCKTFNFTLPNTAGNYFGVVNDDASKPPPFQLSVDFPVNTILECNYLNNLFQFEILPQPPGFDLGPDFSACFDSLISLEAGSGFNSYLWQDGSTDLGFQAQQAGVYWVEATDFCGEKQVDTFQIIIFEKPDIQLDTINGDCFGNPAIAIASVQSAYLPLQYQWSSGNTGTSISSLTDGVFSVTVTDAKSCVSTDSIRVNAGGNLQVSAFVAAPILCFGQSGTLNVNLLTGNPPYNFLWSDGSQNPDLPNALAGDYSVTVTDADNCADTIQISISQPDPLISTGFSTAPSCPGLATGEATFLGAAQATPPYTLLWSNSATTPYLAGLSAGNYQITITDANACTVVDNVQVLEHLPPSLATTEINVSCFGANDGSILVNVVSGTPGFGYLWSNNATSSQIQGLQPGNYALTVTYANETCAQTFDYQIEEPLQIGLSATAGPAICNGGLGGNIDLTVQNGVAPLAYLWSNGASSEDLSDVSAGAYQVTVTDAGSCTQILTQTVGGLPAINVNATTLSPLCAGGTDGNIQVLSSGGTGSFQFFWSNGSNGPQLNDLNAGTYTVTVTDAGACTAVMVIELTEPSALESAGLAAEQACPAEANGTASFLGGSQGTPPYDLLWSTNDIGPSLSGLPAGNYQLTLSDAHGCSLVESVQVTEYLIPVVQPDLLDASCFGSNDGSIFVTLTGGSPGFGYVWSNQATSANIDGLSAGNYSLTLTYADGFCTQIFDYQITEPSALLLLDTLVTAVKCFGENNGAIDLSALGGVAPYQYHWTGNQSTEDLTDLLAGNYSLTLTDKNGCTLHAQFTVPQPAALIQTAIVSADTCQSSTGSIEVNNSGGIQPYLYAWSNAASTSSVQDLQAGNYVVTVSDANACSKLWFYQVPQHGLIPVLSTFTDTLTCAQTTVNVGVLANQNNLQYGWVGPGGQLPDLSTNSVQNPGNYQVTATNAFGCQSVAQLQVFQDIEPPIAEAGPPSMDVSCDETTALLNAAGSSQGNGFLNRWTGLTNSAGALDTLSILLPIFESGLYVHSVLNLENGCTAQDSILVHWDAPIEAVVFVDSIRCFGDRNGRIDLLNVTGGNPPFLHSLGNLPFTTEHSFSGLAPGDYLLRIRDNFGCSWKRSVVLTEPEAISVELSASDTVLYLGQSVQLNALPMPNGLNLVEIDWEPASFMYAPMSLQQRLKPEMHTEFLVNITDEHGCVAEDRLWVSVYNHQIYVPNIILPGSETNSWFTVFAGDGVPLVRFLRVFDRWGEQVFERLSFLPNDPNLGWDGSYRGQPMNPGVFAWYAEVLLFDGRVVFLKGDVTVAR